MNCVDANKLEYAEDQTVFYLGRPFTGVAAYYRKDGTQESAVEYINGVQNGYVRDWNELGVLTFEAEVKNGVYHGDVRTFSENGKIYKSEVYEFGICTTRYEIDDNDVLQLVFSLNENNPNYQIIEAMRLASK